MLAVVRPKPDQVHTTSHRLSSKYLEQRIQGHGPRTQVNGYLVNQVFEEANQLW